MNAKIKVSIALLEEHTLKLNNIHMGQKNKSIKI